MNKTTIECGYCGKRVVPSNPRQKFCGRRCYMKYRKANPGENDTLCWDCKNTNGDVCSWFSKEMKPVEGWTAKLNPTVDGISYFVIACPGFEKEVRVKKYDKK